MIAIGSIYLHLPDVSPAIRVQKKETGEHWTTRRMKKIMPVVTTSVVTVYSVALWQGKSITRRRKMHTDILARTEEMA
jgi:hypothetical protein